MSDETENVGSRIEEAPESSAPASSESEKTRYCERCHKRHRINHPHVSGENGGSDATRTVLGADNAEQLGEQTANQVAKGKKGPRTPKEIRLSPEEQKRRRDSAKRLGRKLAVTPFTIAVLVTANPEWRKQLVEDDIASLSEDWADFAEAWGVQATGKVLAAVSLALGYASVGGKVMTKVAATEVIAEILPVA